MCTQPSTWSEGFLLKQHINSLIPAMSESEFSDNNEAKLIEFMHEINMKG